MNDTKINILGAEYQVIFTGPKEYDGLSDTDGGLCDNENKLIIINSEALPDKKKNEFKVTLRHEIIHAYLFECGLGPNWIHPAMGHDETYVDWIAMQFPKLLKTFKETGCL